jgi:hypothetical protein
MSVHAETALFRINCNVPCTLFKDGFSIETNDQVKEVEMGRARSTNEVE